VTVTKAIHFFASTSSIGPICKADESEALGSLGFPVSGKEDSGDATETLEQIPKF
jgi:hypothetical protein